MTDVQTARLKAVLLPLAVALTLGLAPFAPEPHIVGKIRWIAGGAVGMGPMDWADLAWHGVPWLWLFWALARLFSPRSHKPSA